jgi:hypothetical protein
MNQRRLSVNGSAKVSVLERACRASDAVSSILDQINQGLTKAEKRLRALHPVKDAWTCYRSEPTDPSRPDSCPCIYYQIGLSKHNGEWRLCCGTTHDDYPDEEVAGVEPVNEQSRWVRVEVAEKLPKWFPDLQEQIASTSEDFVPRAKDALAKMMAGLGQI